MILVANLPIIFNYFISQPDQHQTYLNQRLIINNSLQNHVHVLFKVPMLYIFKPDQVYLHVMGKIVLDLFWDFGRLGLQLWFDHWDIFLVCEFNLLFFSVAYLFVTRQEILFGLEGLRFEDLTETVRNDAADLVLGIRQHSRVLSPRRYDPFVEELHTSLQFR